jgi:hypothetical protein
MFGGLQPRQACALKNMTIIHMVFKPKKKKRESIRAFNTLVLYPG